MLEPYPVHGWSVAVAEMIEESRLTKGEAMEKLREMLGLPSELPRVSGEPESAGIGRRRDISRDAWARESPPHAAVFRTALALTPQDLAPNEAL